MTTKRPAKTTKPKEDTAADLTARLDDNDTRFADLEDKIGALTTRVDAIEGQITSQAIQDQAPGPYAPRQVDERITRIEALLGLQPTNVTNDTPGPTIEDRLGRLEHRVFNELSN